MKSIKVLIIGAGKGGSSILRFFLKQKAIRIVGVSDINLNAPAIKIALENNIPVFSDFKKMLFEKRNETDVIIEATGLLSVQEELKRLKPNRVSVLEAEAASLMMTIIEENLHLYKVKETEELLQTILNSAQEGIQVVDKDGKIVYINKAFTNITKIPPEERINKSVFQVSPDGALCEVLRTGKPVFGKPNIVKGSNIEVVSNASPIIVNGKITGAVVIFRDVTDMKRILKKLNEREELIKNLKGSINNLTAAKYTFDDLIGENPVFKESISIAKKAAEADTTVLLTGESGTGKELFAHAIHNYSFRKNKPFIRINCAAIPPNLLESELFGYEKGAFTGAIERKIGKFELADGGTIFLDEIGDMDTNLQAKILRVLQEKEIERLGGSKPVRINVRVIAATNRNLIDMIRQGNFREDLFYRLNVLNISIPPLRERINDIPKLAERIMMKLNQKSGKKIVRISNDALKSLMAYSWPGNVRELENVLERAITLADSDVIDDNLIRPYLKPDIHKNDEEDILPLDEVEKRVIESALKKYGTSLPAKKKIAEKLNISLATLYNKLKKYRLNYKI
ncbi:Arginine utilization regulatory protein RocR [Koleobacter methoxysyntrophicus]|uniref:Arginine utilization regulatory protein RocR n=1 Tax=Koleobacter methoxysyntrophicus TaxID=2751313 RepID=A0A8A0RKX9_9FIRM|nr:sigma 54-interacting transcriptional regulator [Koleobacter methoxysyntrophicus]QSQ08374.1 Arginine utilization regulatory protein RocR [Koleobacter methoxysyntrophicus]